MVFRSTMFWRGTTLCLLGLAGCYPQLRRDADCSIFAPTDSAALYDQTCCNAKQRLCEKQGGDDCEWICDG